MENDVLTIPNFHVAGCGESPDLIAGEQYYTAYLENEHGEQLVFQYNRNTETGLLWHGDYGWEKPHSVTNGTVSLTMDQAEHIWLALVWRIATCARRLPKRVKCLACGKEFWNTELVVGHQGAHCPFCGKHKWEFLKRGKDEK